MKPVLETARIKLIPFELADIDLLHQILTDPFVRKYLMDDVVITYEKANEFIVANEKYFINGGWGLWKLLLKKENSYAGLGGLWSFFGEEQPQLLYALLPDQVKKGYATEVSKAVIDYAFNKLKFNYLIAVCDTPNLASKKVCERLNMKEIEEKEINGNKTTIYKIENDQTP